MRITTRQFPDAAQLGITGTVVINESRITFTGPRGRVLAMWKINANNPAAVVVPTVSFQVVGSALSAGLADNGQGNIIATAGADTEPLVLFTVVDPAAGTFVEVQAVMGGLTIDVGIGTGTLWVVSLPPGAEEGPVVTVL